MFEENEHGITIDRVKTEDVYLALRGIQGGYYSLKVGGIGGDAEIILSFSDLERLFSWVLRSRREDARKQAARHVQALQDDQAELANEEEN